MNDLGGVLVDGADGVAKDIVRANLLLERSAEGAHVLAQAHVGKYLRHGLKGFQKNPVRAKQWLECTATAGDVDAMLDLADVLEYGDDGVPKNTTLANEFYERAGKSKTTQTSGLEEERHSVFETAFASALRGSNAIDEAFVVQNIVASNVDSATDFLWGHNLILLSIRAGLVTSENIRTIGRSSWYLQENLYYIQPAVAS